MVAAKADDVTTFEVGDEVYARSDVSTGRCYAEFVELNVSTVARKLDQQIA